MTQKDKQSIRIGHRVFLPVRDIERVKILSMLDLRGGRTMKLAS